MKKKTLMSALAGTLVGLLVGVVLGYFVTSPSQPSQTQDLQNQINNLQNQVSDLQNQIAQKENQIQALQQQVSELETLLGPIRKGAWNLITTFNGASGVKTDYFYVGGTDLRFNWTWASTTPKYAIFSIKLYKKGETTFTETYLFLEDRGTTYAHNIAAANYYLDISTANLASWTVTVEQWIPES